MALLSYWTIPYVSLEDSRLVWAYNVAFMAIIGSLLGNIFVYMTYLQSDMLHGLAQARLKTPASWSPRPEAESFCSTHSCVRWDAEEVGHSYTSDSLFVTTRIKDNLERSLCEPEAGAEAGDMVSCAEYRRESKLNYYPVNVEELSMILNADAESLEFCNSDNHYEGKCPYEYNLRTLPGRLIGVNGSVLARFNMGDMEREMDNLRDLTVRSFLTAAGVESLDDDVLREKGGVFLINIKFHLDFSKIGYLTGLLSRPDTAKLPSKFTIRVNRLAQAGYKMKEVVSHDRDTRRSRTYYGLQFKLQVSGKAKRFSWSKLISEVVITFGLLGVVNNVLDLVWQLVFPLLGFPDYNDLVYRSVRPEGQEDSGLGSQENSCLEKEAGGSGGQKVDTDILSPDL